MHGPLDLGVGGSEFAHDFTGDIVPVDAETRRLPFDGAMIGMAAFLEREPPRFLRSMVERFVPSTPFVSPFLARCGQILGTPENCRRLLAAGEVIQVFPEGVGGRHSRKNEFRRSLVCWPHAGKTGKKDGRLRLSCLRMREKHNQQRLLARVLL